MFVTKSEHVFRRVWSGYTLIVNAEAKSPRGTAVLLFPATLFGFRNNPKPILQISPDPLTAPVLNLRDLSLLLPFSRSCTPTPSSECCGRSQSAPGRSGR